jgi:hypothetical protein
MKQSAFDQWLTTDPHEKGVWGLVDQIMTKHYFPDMPMCSCDEELDETCEIHQPICCCQEGWCGACQIHGENL